MKISERILITIGFSVPFVVIATVFVCLFQTITPQNSYLVVHASEIPTESQVVKNAININAEQIRQEIIEEKYKEKQKELDAICGITDTEEWYKEYRNVCFRYVKWLPIKSIADIFTSEEIRLICQVVETEVYDKDFDSKVNVANVVFNRIENGSFGENVEEVVTSPSQFAYYRENLTEDTILAVMYAFEMEDTTDGALYFHSNDRTDTFHGNYLFTDNAGHHFYK